MASASTDRPGGEMNIMPERIKEALEQARDFPEYQELRVFRFLHMFSGERDVLGECLKEMAKKEGLQVEVYSLDKKGEGDVDLAKDHPFLELKEEAEAHAFDAGHAGFPCNTFSRARWNMDFRGPPPVRSLQHIYGLPSNSVEEQQMADVGTLLASRSVVVIGAILKSQRLRQVPQAGTLENPPGSSTREEGPAWELPEIKAFMDACEGQVADYNTCSFQTEERVRWFKPGRFAGRLLDLETLKKPCTCGQWIRHEPLVGHQKTAAAAQYPKQLCEAYCKLLITAFKHTLQLEYWRNMLKTKEQEVSGLKRKWIESKEKIYRGPPEGRPTADPSKRVWESTQINQDLRPIMGMSKKARREEENERYIGGMRNPGRAVEKLSVLRRVGMDVGRIWDRFIEDYPEALEVAKNYSSQGNRPNMEVEMAWKGALKQFFQTRAFTDIVLKDKYEFDSPLDPELWEAWLKTAADPEQHLVEWIRKGVPLGMSKEIPCCGIFPMSDDPEQEVEETPELANQLGMENYKSFTDEPEHAKAELGRLVAEGFAAVLPTNKASAMHQRGTVSKLALLVKAKEDGSVKRRIIIDLLRSGGNARCKVPERIVLPRVMDVVDSFRYLWKTRDRMPIKARDEEWELDEDRPEGGIYDFEMVTADLSDAYCHLPVHPDEHHNCLSPGIYPSETLMWVAMLFGFRGAPLLMGRFAACLARIWQSLIAPSEMQSQLYMDDPMWILRGPTSRRNRNLALLLYTARALGINLAWHKGSRGSQLTWIGVMFEVMQAEAEVKLTVPKKMMEEIRSSLESWESKGMISLREVQQVTGRLSWVAGILPRTRWAVSIMYAVIADVKRAEEDERRRASQRSDTRPKHGLVSVKRLELPRRWFMVFFKDPGVLALRTEPMEERPPDFAIVTDASPQGIGAVLATVDHNVGQTFTILEALEIPVLEEDAKWLGVEWKESSSQGPLEAWAVKLAFRRWGNRLEGKSVILRSDSVVALAMTKRLSSPSPVINWIGAELAIRCDRHGVKRVITQHIPGNWNVEADWLSRPHERNPAKPERLKDVPIKTFPRNLIHGSYLSPPGVSPALWGASASQVSGAFELL